jgi:hypothetical protein
MNHFVTAEERINAMQSLIEKKGPIDLVALMSAGTNSRSY